MESILNRRGWINYKQLGTEESNDGEPGIGDENDEVHWSRVRLVAPTRSRYNPSQLPTNSPDFSTQI